MRQSFSVDYELNLERNVCVIMRKLGMILMTTVLLAVGMTGCGQTRQEQKDDQGQAATAVEQQGSDTSSDTSQKETEGDASSEDTAGDLLSGKHHVKIKVKKYGTISVELDADTAPISTTNFVNLAKDGFYDGLTFHRIISGFMIQGGDPLGNGTGGSEQTIQGEFAANGIENNMSHKRGVISMARSQDFNSASSQFFIMHKDNEGLDGQYAAFGSVTDGMDIVDKICEDTPVTDDNGTVEKENQPVIEKIKVVD